MKILLAILSVGLILSVMGCPTQQVIPDPRTPTEEDMAYCKPGCDYLMTLLGRDGNPGCEEARPLVFPDGHSISCEDFCIEVQQQGRIMNPKCWLTIEVCDELESQCRLQ